MSELGYISKKYSRISRLTDDINNASIAVKKHSLKQDKDAHIKYPKLIISEQVYNISKEILVVFLNSLLQLIEKGTSESDIRMLLENNAYKEQINKNPELKQDIISLLKNLENDKSITKVQFKLLDTLIGVLDNERSYLFRKMRNIAE